MRRTVEWTGHVVGVKQKVVEGEVGSSTMPQKVNPIHFENAGGQSGIHLRLLTHYIHKLSVSRLQRDLSDSTVRRTFGVALGHTLLAWNNVTRGMSRVDADEEKIRSEFNVHWEVVSEGAQTILRAAGRSDAYESLKSQTRGRQMDGVELPAVGRSAGCRRGNAREIDEFLARVVFGSRGSNHRFCHALSGVITETKRKLRFRPSSALRSAQDEENL